MTFIGSSSVRELDVASLGTSALCMRLVLHGSHHFGEQGGNPPPKEAVVTGNSPDLWHTLASPRLCIHDCQFMGWGLAEQHVSRVFEQCLRAQLCHASDSVGGGWSRICG